MNVFVVGLPAKILVGDDGDRRLAAVRRRTTIQDALAAVGRPGGPDAGRAEPVADNRTEKPTPKRRDEARKKGQIARSTEVNSAAVLLGGIVGAHRSPAPAMLDELRRRRPRRPARSPATPDLAGRAGLGDAARRGAMTSVLAIAAPIALAAARRRPRRERGAEPAAHHRRRRSSRSSSRINPRTGFKRLFGTKALFERGQGDREDGRRRRRGVRRHLAAADRPGRARRARAPAQILEQLAGADRDARPVRRASRFVLIGDRRLRLAALPAREVAEDDQGGGTPGVAPDRPRARGARRDPPAPVRAARRSA